MKRRNKTLNDNNEVRLHVCTHTGLPHHQFEKLCSHIKAVMHSLIENWATKIIRLVAQ